MDQFKEYTSLLALCNCRKSTREFSDKPVPHELIEKILTVARTSPYASNKKSWEMLTITERPVIDELAEAVRLAVQKAAACIRDDLSAGFQEYAAHFSMFQSAPLLLVPVFRVGKSFTYMMGKKDCNGFSAAQFERDNYVKSISCVAMSAILAAQSLGLASCYMTGPLIAEEAVSKILKIKKGRQIGAIIPVGYA
ncbi:MAG: nitroreductase family protein [bacterium]|nr:nitroreductase family protein [bacterium]